MIGQSAVDTAKRFDALLILWFILTKLDGCKGWCCIIDQIGHGQTHQIFGYGGRLRGSEDFRPDGLADRILGFGDVVGLMNDFEKVTNHEEAEKDAMKMLQGDFSFEDFMKQRK